MGDYHSRPRSLTNSPGHRRQNTIHRQRYHRRPPLADAKITTRGNGGARPALRPVSQTLAIRPQDKDANRTDFANHTTTMIRSAHRHPPYTVAPRHPLPPTKHKHILPRRQPGIGTKTPAPSYPENTSKSPACEARHTTRKSMNIQRWGRPRQTRTRGRWTRGYRRQFNRGWRRTLGGWSFIR